MARRGSRTLILDLRANEGGLDCGVRVIPHLIDRPLAPPAYERRVRFREAPAALRPYLDTWDRSFDRLGVEATDIGGGFLRLPTAADATIQPIGPRFSGRLLVLTSATNSSATFQFANLVRTAGLGALIGETTGGNRRGINGGAYYFVRLPESGLEVDLPLIGYFPRTPQPDAGIVPDVPVSPSVADIAVGRDRILERALEIASG
jgi:C-terminal processing protease CtpA/Prc